MSKDKMTPTPWEADESIEEINIISMKSEHNFSAIATLKCDPVDDETRANASAIVTAVNNTYGQQINPEAVPNLFRILHEIVSDTYKGGVNRNLLLEEAKTIIEKSKLPTNE